MSKKREEEVSVPRSLLEVLERANVGDYVGFRLIAHMLLSKPAGEWVPLSGSVAAKVAGCSRNGAALALNHLIEVGVLESIRAKDHPDWPKLLYRPNESLYRIRVENLDAIPAANRRTLKARHP